MVYKSIYFRLCSDKIVNIVCDKQQYAIVWDYESRLRRAPLLLAAGWYKSHEQAIAKLTSNSVIRGYAGFTVFEENFLLRCKEVAAVDLKAVEIAQKSKSGVCPLCGHAIK